MLERTLSVVKRHWRGLYRMGKGTVYVFKPKLKTTRVGLVGARQECHRETGWVGCYWGKPRETGMIGTGDPKQQL